MAKTVDEVFKYDPRSRKRIRERPRLSLKIDPAENMTQQNFKEECDINNIMAKYRVTGTAPQHSRRPIAGDFANLPDYQEALNTVIEAEKAFMSLPSQTRERFHNDPGRFVAFCQNPENADELVQMGLAKAPVPPPEPVQVRIVQDPGTPPPDDKK